MKYKRGDIVDLWIGGVDRDVIVLHRIKCTIPIICDRYELYEVLCGTSRVIAHYMDGWWSLYYLCESLDPNMERID